MTRLVAVGCALLAAWLSCIPGGPGDSSSGQGAGGTPLTDSCRQTCEKKFPAGATSYEALQSCLVCGACHDRCAADLGIGCAGAMEKGCSAGSKSCGECIVSSCAIQQKPDTTFTGACAMEGTACAQQPDCVGVYDCVSKCVANGGASGKGGGSGEGGGMGGAGGCLTCDGVLSPTGSNQSLCPGKSTNLFQDLALCKCQTSQCGPPNGACADFCNGKGPFNMSSGSVNFGGPCVICFNSMTFPDPCGKEYNACIVDK